jgi:nitrogen regulatory protein P-II 1
MHFKLIIAMTKTAETDNVIDAAKAAGGTGATVIPARGTGIHEAKSFFGLSLEVQTDVILLLVEERLVEPVLEAIDRSGRLKEPGGGIAFVLDVNQVVGLESQIKHFENEAEKLGS